MSSRNPSVSTPLPLHVASGRVVKKYQRIRAFSAELDRGYCLQAQLQSAAFRSSYVLGSHVAQCLPNQLRFGCDRDHGTNYWAGPDWYSARSHRCSAGRALISGLQ